MDLTVHSCVFFVLVSDFAVFESLLPPITDQLYLDRLIPRALTAVGLG